MEHRAGSLRHWLRSQLVSFTTMKPLLTPASLPENDSPLNVEDLAYAVDLVPLGASRLHVSRIHRANRENLP
jgi:hypothetical protein